MFQQNSHFNLGIYDKTFLKLVEMLIPNKETAEARKEANFSYNLKKKMQQTPKGLHLINCNLH